MRKFRDTENGEILTEEQLRMEYEEGNIDIYEASGARTFEEYIANATDKNGFFGRGNRRRRNSD